MWTLSDAIATTKSVLKWGGVGVIGVIILILIVKVILGILAANTPPPLPPNYEAFGKLPQLVFPPNATNSQLSYTINTNTGTDETDQPATSSAVVYRLSPQLPNLQALAYASAGAALVGFTSPPSRESSTTYLWQKVSPLLKTLSYNIRTNSFDISSNYMQNSSIINGAISKDDAITFAKTFFVTNLSGLPDDIETASTSATLYQIQNNNLIENDSQTTSQIARVDFYQKDIPVGNTSYHIYYPDYPFSTMSIFVGSGQEIQDQNVNGQVVQAHFVHTSIGSDFGTYPIISAKQAYSELTSGQAYIASYDPNIGQAVEITDISLGYYLGDTNQTYLMPVYVYKGNGNFAAYVPAVTDGMISK